MEILDAVGIHLGNIALNFDDEQAERAMINKMQSQLAEAPNLKKAINFKLENSLCQSDLKPFPVCKTTTKEIGSYSIGLELYFLFLKQMAVLFFLVSCISVWPIYVNYNGGYFDVQDPLDASAAVSIGNLKSDNFDEDSYFVAWFSNACYTVLVLILLPCFVMQATLRIRKNLKTHDLLTDYAIQVKGFPPEGITTQDLLNHFECEGGIYEIYIARKYNNMLFNYRKRANYKLSLIHI